MRARLGVRQRRKMRRKKNKEKKFKKRKNNQIRVSDPCRENVATGDLDAVEVLVQAVEKEGEELLRVLLRVAAELRRELPQAVLELGRRGRRVLLAPDFLLRFQAIIRRFFGKYRPWMGRGHLEELGVLVGEFALHAERVVLVHVLAVLVREEVLQLVNTLQREREKKAKRGREESGGDDACVSSWVWERHCRAEFMKQVLPRLYSPVRPCAAERTVASRTRARARETTETLR